MVAVALDLVPDGVFPGVRAGGDGLGVGAVFTQAVEQLAVGGGACPDQRLRAATVGQAVNGSGRGIVRRDAGDDDINLALHRVVIDQIGGGKDNGLTAGVGRVGDRLTGFPAPCTRHILAVKGGALAGDRADGNFRAGVVRGDDVRQGQDGRVPLRQGEDDRNGGVLVVLGTNQKGEGDDVASGGTVRQSVGDCAGVHVNAPTVLNPARGRIGPAVERVRVGYLRVIGHSQTLEVGEGDGLLCFQAVLLGDLIGSQRGRGGLADREGRAGRTEDIVAAFLIGDGNGGSTRVCVIAVGDVVFLRVNGIAEVVCEGNGRLNGISAVIGAVRDGDRGCHFSWRDRPRELHLAGVVTQTAERKIIVVCADLRRSVAGKAIICASANACQCYAVQNDTDYPGPFFRPVIHKGVFQRDDRAYNGLGIDRDLHLSGGRRVLRRVRGERPFGLTAARVEHERAVRPCEGAGNLFTGGRVFHLARDRACIQRLTVGDLACGHLAIRNGRDLVLCEDVDGQGDVLVVAGCDNHRHRADIALRIDRVCQNGQNQLAVFDLRSGSVAVAGIHGDGRRAIGDVAVGLGAFQCRQQRRQIDLVGSFQAVDDGQRTVCRHGRVGLGDGETGRIVGCKSVTDRFGAFRLALKHIVVVRKRHGEGKGLSVSDVRRGQVAPVRLLHGKLGVREGERRIGKYNARTTGRLAEERQPARGKRDVCGAVVGLGDSFDGEKADRQRGNGYGERTGSRFVVCCFRFVVNGVRACVGESRSVRSIVAVYLVAVGERHGSAVYTLPKRDSRCVLRLAGVIRAGCPHGNSRQLCRFDCDGHGAGRGGVFFVAFRRGERPFGVIAARVGLDGAVLPRERTRNHGLCAGADHRTRGRECALCQRLAVGDIRRADADARLIEGDPLANDDLDGQLERLIVRAYNRDGQSADLIVHIRAVRGHDGQSQNAFV